MEEYTLSFFKNMVLLILVSSDICPGLDFRLSTHGKMNNSDAVFFSGHQIWGHSMFILSALVKIKFHM
jgi:hypothetical protein